MEIGRTPESFGQGQEPDLLALLGLEEQEWASGLAPPPVEEDVREGLPMLDYNHNMAAGSRQVSRASSHPFHVRQRL